jgi:hypothetical protein
MKKGPVPTVEAQIADLADLKQRAEKIESIWSAAGLPGPLSADQSEKWAWHISSCAAQPIDTKKERLNADARAAIRKLLMWCRYDPNTNGLPHLVFQDRRLSVLEDALLQAQPLAEGLSRVWVNQAWSIWSRVVTITKSAQSNITPNSPTVQFTSQVLKWVGHPDATPNAISMELRNNPKFRKQMSFAPVQLTL